MHLGRVGVGVVRLALGEARVQTLLLVPLLVLMLLS